MRSKRLRRLILTWVVPAILLVIILVGLLQDYKKQNKNFIDSFVESGIEQTGGTYSRNVSSVLAAMKNVTDIVDEMLESRGDANLYYLVQSLDAIKDSNAAFSVLYCYADGDAITTGHKNVNLANTDYYPALKGTESFFMYTEDDGITGKDALLYVSPVEYKDGVSGYLIACLDPAELNEIFLDGNSYGDQVFYAVVDSGGNILASFGGVENTAFLEDDFWHSIREGAQSSGSWNVFDRLRENRQFGKLDVVKGQEERILCEFPIADTQWYLVMGLNQEYVDRLVGRVYKPMMWLLVKIGICLVCYLAIVVVINVVAHIRNTEQKRVLEDKADTDLLTGLNNKISTERKIREYIADFPDGQGVMFLIDLDNFKKINDTLGHAFGDEVLRCLGMRLQSMFRVTDIIGRIGGDEFIVFLKDIMNDADIEREGRKLEQFFRNFEVGEYVKYSVTASVGGAVFSQDADTFEDLYKAADKAVYVSKKQGKNQLCFYRIENEQRIVESAQ